jgi:hypothetical protein
MLSDPSATIYKIMSAAPEPLDLSRRARALSRLFEHCELAGERAAFIEERRVAVRARLEQELGSELTGKLLASLTTRRTRAL